MRALRLLAARLASLRSLRSAIPSPRPSFRSCSKHLPQVLNGGPAGLELFLRFPTGISEMEAARPPKFLDDPHSHLPCSSTPAGPPRQARSTFRCCPCIVNCEDSRTCCYRGSVARLLRSLSTLHGHSHPWSCKTRFRLLARLYRVGLSTNRVVMKGFSLYASSFPKLCLAR